MSSPPSQSLSTYLPQSQRQRWRPAPLIQASAALHVASLPMLAWQPGSWPWVATALVANHALLTGAGLVPRCAWLGTNWRRLPLAAQARGQIALTFDDGPDPELTPPVLALLAQHQVRATFFCIGERVQRYPQLARQMVAAGHALENHSQHHRHNFSFSGPRQFARELAQAQHSITEVSGEPPRFFRAPAGLRNPFLDRELARQGLQLASWTRRGFDTVTRHAAVVARRLLTRLAAGDILLLHDGHAARNAQGEPVVLQVLPQVLAAIQAAQLTPVRLRDCLDNLPTVREPA